MQHLADEQQPPAVYGVGHRAPDEGAGEDGDDLGEADEADVERRVGEAEDLIGNRHHRQLRAEDAHEVAGPEPAELGELAKGGDVDEESAHRHRAKLPNSRSPGARTGRADLSWPLGKGPLGARSPKGWS